MGQVQGSGEGAGRIRVPHFSLFPPRVAFSAWVDFHARSRFARSTIPEEKWGTTRSLNARNANGYARCIALTKSEEKEGPLAV